MTGDSPVNTFWVGQMFVEWPETHLQIHIRFSMAARRKNARERPDDGRMYGMSDVGYQETMKRLTKRQRALNDQANAARRKNDAALFVQGTEATDNTTS